MFSNEYVQLRMQKAKKLEEEGFNPSSHNSKEIQLLKSF